VKYGASEGIRTLDVHLGKVMLYQTELRSRSKSLEFKEWHPDCKISFLKVFGRQSSRAIFGPRFAD
jgi:hypothetical protein